MKKLSAILLLACFTLLGANELSAQRNMGYHAYSYDGGFRVSKRTYKYPRSYRSYRNEVRGFAQARKSCNKPCASKRSSCSNQNKRACSNKSATRKACCKSKSSCSKQRSSCRSYKSWDYSDHSDIRDVPHLKRRNACSRSKMSCSSQKASCAKQKAACAQGSRKACCKSKSSCSKQKASCAQGQKKACCKKKGASQKQRSNTSRYNRY